RSPRPAPRRARHLGRRSCIAPIESAAGDLRMLSIEPQRKLACRQLAADGGGRLRRTGTKEADEAGIGAAKIGAVERGERVAEEAARLAVDRRVSPRREGSRLAAGGNIFPALEFRAAEPERVIACGVRLPRESADPDPGATEEGPDGR